MLPQIKRVQPCLRYREVEDWPQDLRIECKRKVVTRPTDRISLYSVPKIIRREPVFIDLSFMSVLFLETAVDSLEESWFHLFRESTEIRIPDAETRDSTVVFHVDRLARTEDNGLGVAVPLDVATFSNRMGIEENLKIAVDLVRESFSAIEDLSLMLEEDPDDPDESWVSVGFVSKQSVQDFHRSYRAYTSDWIAATDPLKRRLVRLSYSLE